MKECQWEGLGDRMLPPHTRSPWGVEFKGRDSRVPESWGYRFFGRNFWTKRATARAWVRIASAL